MHNSLLHLLLKNGDFLNPDILPGSIATRFRCGGVFVYDFVTYFLLSLIVKKMENWPIFGKVMGKNLVSCFFDSQCSYMVVASGYQVALFCITNLAIF